MDTGFITLHRKIKENEIWKNPELSHLFIHLLLSANHDVKKFLFNGKVEQVGRGQMITGRKVLSQETGIHESKIARFLKLLKDLEIIDIQPNNRFSLITIIKYSDYQDKKERLNSRLNNKRTTSEQPVNTNNNDNNDNNVNNNIAAEPPEINLLLDFFKKTVNEHLKFNNKTERKACKDLLTTYGIEKTKQALLFLEEKRKTDKYLPLITTPYELWTKWAKIKQHLTIKKRKIWKTTSPSLPSLPDPSTK